MDLIFAHYGEERERIATEDELEIFKILQDLTGSPDLRLVRKSDNYVSAVVGDWDLARFKYTTRAKWISFPIVERGSAKNRIERPEDVRAFSEKIEASYAHIIKYTTNG